MDSVGIPYPSPPLNPFSFKDCSQQICTAFCPQWCAFMFQPPPPPLFGLDDSDDSGTFFSPLIVAVIGILASAFVLVTYYAIVSKYCRRRVAGSGGGGGGGDGGVQDRAMNETRGSGLDESLIKSISIYKFKTGEGLIEGSDCSVCLSEFQENESLRLLPKCSHAFHLACIDTWLKSNSSCPLCRCNIAPVTPPPSATALGYRRRSDAAVVVVQDPSANVSQEAIVVEIASDSTNEAQEIPDPDLDPNPNPNPNPSSFDQGDGRTERRERSVHSIRSVSDSDSDPVSVSVSDHRESTPCPGRNLSVADILSINHEEDEETEAVDSSMAAGIGSSNCDGKETEKSRNRNGVLNSAVRISISSGIFSFTRYSKGKNSNSSPN